MQAFAAEVGRAYRGKCLTVSSDARDLERFWRDIESWAVIYFTGMDWRGDRRVVESIKVNAFGETLKQLLEDNSKTRTNLRVDTVRDLARWLERVCTKRVQSKQSEAFDKL